MAFSDRIHKSEIATEMFDEYCGRKGIHYAKSGYEELVNSSPAFLDGIRKIDTKTAHRIRFFPDRQIVSLKDAYLVEIKYGKSIEKDAYDVYMDLNSIGFNVGIVYWIPDKNNLLYVNIDMLIIKKAFSKTLPIIEGKWYAPRMLDQDEYNKWKSVRHNASGTTFGIVDFKETNFIELV